MGIKSLLVLTESSSNVQLWSCGAGIIQDKW